MSRLGSQGDLVVEAGVPDGEAGAVRGEGDPGGVLGGQRQVRQRLPVPHREQAEVVLAVVALHSAWIADLNGRQWGTYGPVLALDKP